MNPEVQAAIIQVAGMWVIETAKITHLDRDKLEKTLMSSFKETYERLAAAVSDLPNP
jgi:hypothetical protein